MTDQELPPLANTFTVAGMYHLVSIYVLSFITAENLKNLLMEEACLQGSGLPTKRLSHAGATTMIVFIKFHIFVTSFLF